MAKIALCGYGHDGRGLGKSDDGYAYVVNDNVNVGDQIQVVATNWRSGRKFATTAMPRSTYKEMSVAGQIVKQNAEEASNSGEITEAYSGSQLGIKGFRGGEAYKQQVRAQNLQAYMQEHPTAEASKNGQTLMKDYGKEGGVSPKSNYESFAEYAKKFM